MGELVNDWHNVHGKPAGEPAHIWNAGLYCVHCGTTTILALLRNPETKGVGPCPGNDLLTED